MRLEDLEAVLLARLEDPPPGSYSATLLADPERAARKIMEEAFELCLELGRGAGLDRRRTAAEAADLLFHVLAGLVGAGVSLSDVMRELDARRPAPAGGREIVSETGARAPAGGGETG